MDLDPRPSRWGGAIFLTQASLSGTFLLEGRMQTSAWSLNATLSPTGTELRGSVKEEVDVRNCPYGLSGRKGTWKKKKAVESELRSRVKVEVDVPGSRPQELPVPNSP